MTTRIDVAELCDQYIDTDINNPARPQLWSFNIDNRVWLTDRKWLLPADVCNLTSGNFDVQHVTGEKTVASARRYINALTHGAFRPTGHLFAATFAGVLTLAGLTAYAVDSETHMCALIDSTSARVGIFMPHKTPTPTSLPIPASAECVDMYRRLRAAGSVVRPWQCWELAAHLTSQTAPVA